ncbi:hypothetical protein K438DRAFT_1995566 [Mycena galopus ATCC 62051]|nr:hypothetical protein K438DRAFT_1995566 [Mycena galopus ATCC 62051]
MSVDLPPTNTPGVTFTPSISATHSARPSPSHLLHSEKQSKAPVGLIVGVALAIIAFLVALAFLRYFFVRRAQRRKAFEGPGRVLGGPPTATAKGKDAEQGYAHTMPVPTGADAVELSSYPPPASIPNPNPNPNPPPPPTHTTTGSWSTAFSGAGARTTQEQEPGPGSSPAARQAYLAAELRAAQALLERAGGANARVGDKSIDVKATKARIRALEERQTSAWALGLE